LLVSLAMAPPVIQRWLDSVVICIAVGFPATTPAGAASALALDGTDGTTRSAAACCRAGYRSFSCTSFLCRVRCLCRAPLRSQVLSGRFSGERMWVDEVADIHLAGETCF
jgi:hypothetical protein